MPPRASPTATSSAWAPRSASPPTSCTRAARSASKGSPRRSTWCSGTEKFGSSGFIESPLVALALLGGTFDPVHNAHLAMARAALDFLHLKRLLFLPTGPTKYREPAVAAPEHRVAMLHLALEGEP